MISKEDRRGLNLGGLVFVVGVLATIATALAIVHRRRKEAPNENFSEIWDVT
jgi:hypothetical protein